MSEDSLPRLGGLSAQEERRVEKLCTCFENGWKEPVPRRPRLEDFLRGEEGLPAGVLLCDLLYLELAYRVKRGEQPMRSEYLTRFPGQENHIDKVFVTVGVKENPADADMLTAVPPSGPDDAEGEMPPEPGVFVPSGFQNVERLGEGSMGTVYKALQLNTKRKVALKVIRADRLRKLSAEERQKWFARFQWEGEAVAKLDHPNIVPLHDVHEFKGQPFFSMKFVEGDSLASKLEHFRSDPRAAAQLMALVARAVHHAHQRQILHRDLKPHNILIDSQGQPLVTDFGLALRIDPSSADNSTRDGIAGTPAYMAPEQARADGGLTTAVDVYGLGAVLYQLLAGEPPHQGKNKSETLRNAREDEPKAPRAINPHADRDLEAVCLKCLSKEPAKRYGSAQEVAEDLERWLHGEPIHARRVGLVERFRKWVRRRPGVTAAWACVLMALLTAGFFAYQGANSRAERLQLAFDHGIEVALSGKLKQSEDAIRDVERYGGSRDQVRFLRGLVAFQQSDTESAIADLELATELNPNSVAARALLAIFHFRAGHWYLHDRQMEQLAKMQASTPEDFLFKGYQQSFYDSKEALKTLDEALRRRETNIAYAIRADVLARYALDRDPDMAKDAETDAGKARLPDHPFAISASLQAHLVAAILNPDNRKSALEKAAEDVNKLEGYHKYPWVGEHCAYYYEMMGKDYTKNVDDALKKAAGFKNNPAIFAHAANLWRRGRADRALEELKKRTDDDDSEGDRLYTILLPKSEFTPEFFERWTQKNYPPEDAPIVWLWMGKAKDARESALNIIPPQWPVTPDRKLYDEQYKTYAAAAKPSESADNALLHAAKWSRSCRCSAHFLIGMTHFANDNRNDAMKHLDLAVKTQDYFNNDFILGRAILADLARLKN